MDLVFPNEIVGTLAGISRWNFGPCLRSHHADVLSSADGKTEEDLQEDLQELWLLAWSGW
jgi:hypothetical protein